MCPGTFVKLPYDIFQETSTLDSIVGPEQFTGP